MLEQSKQIDMSITISDFWDSNYYNHPPLTAEMVSTAEKTLNAKLPDLLIVLLTIQNGGYTRGFAFPMVQKTKSAENHIPVSELFGIVTDKNIITAQNILESECISEEWGLPEKQILLAGDGHWWITLDYRKGNIPGVRWFDVEFGEDMHIANSFDEFIAGLVPGDEFVDD